MKKILFALMIICLWGGYSHAQTTNPAHQWFREARFGLFVHFGPYSVLSDGEWIMNRKPYTVAQYGKLQHIFNPQLFDARKWVQTAKAAGMKYITFTSRHHDSFSNWDTKQSDWNIMNTPYGKDLVKQLADECHREGIKLVLYYSLLDWYRTDYSHTTGRTGKGTGRTEQGNWENYVAFMKAQLTELLTNYGEIAGIWFDGEWDQMGEEKEANFGHEHSKVNWHFDEIYGLIHQLQPNCMIGNNHHLEPLPGEDFQAFERDLPGENKGGYSAKQAVTNTLPLESCETMNKSWGFRLNDEKYKSTTELIHYLVRAAGYGANLLLNVGPMPTGEIDPDCVTRLHEMGEWTAKNGHTIYGTQGGYLRPQTWGAITQKGNKRYVHILAKEGDTLTIPCPDKILSAKWLNLAGKLTWKQNKKTGDVTFTLDAPMDPVDTIIEVTVK